jgi:DDE superfamily endonuclease
MRRSSPDGATTASVGARLDPFLFCCGYTQTFAHLNTCVRGLLSDLPRKSVEPIALRGGTPVRTLQEFLKDHAWDFGGVPALAAAAAADE